MPTINNAIHNIVMWSDPHPLVPMEHKASEFEQAGSREGSGF